jgi:thiamine-monophosphate kinase
VVGIGDDAAVARAGGELCASSIDTMVEGVHFRLGEGWATPHEVGWRAMAGALSDLAAVGAAPGEVFLSLGLPAGFAEQNALLIALGADELAGACGAAIAGGDVVAAPVVFASIAVNGWLAAGERPLTRDGARPGDLVGVTGELGSGAAALAVMDGRAPAGADVETALERARRPWPRLAEGRALAAAGASAAIDVSDGLAADAEQLGHASGVSLALQAELLPLAPGVEHVASRLGLPGYLLGAAGGEDYELCFCAPQARRGAVEAALEGAGGTVSWIGEAREGFPGARLSDGRGDVVRAEGYEHRW